VVVDSHLETPPSARIVQPPGTVWIYTAADLTQQSPNQQALQAAGVHITHCPGPGKTPGGPAKVDLRAMLADLGRRHINELHLEAGHKLNGSFLREGWVDEVLLYLAPTLLGHGAGLSNLGPFQVLDQGVALQWISAHAVGTDLCLRARRTPLP
jgi:diaminohydroxyphosphoribosylaminopyrimidine deaminase / 5-amino-6-(5-phosphoribosylamino)uracil reductase